MGSTDKRGGMTLLCDLRMNASEINDAVAFFSGSSELHAPTGG